jgi:hypothetical protein
LIRELALALDATGPIMVCSSCAERYGPDAQDDLHLWLQMHRDENGMSREEALRWTAPTTTRC